MAGEGRPSTTSLMHEGQSWMAGMTGVAPKGRSFGHLVFYDAPKRAAFGAIASGCPNRQEESQHEGSFLTQISSRCTQNTQINRNGSQEICHSPEFRLGMPNAWR